MAYTIFKQKIRVLTNPLRTIIRNLNTQRVIYDFNEFLGQPGLTATEPRKRALVSYLVKPLIPPVDKRDTSTFSNPGIAQYIPRALNELGYSVDIVNYDNKQFVPTKKYDLFIGHAGINFENIESRLDQSCIKIYFSTGTYWPEWNWAEIDRLEALKKRKGALLPADRQIVYEEEYANVHSDGIICLGNQHAKSTYSKFPLVINVNNAVFPDSYSPTGKKFEKTRNNFLYFNGGGNVHKGLDLLLEAFTRLEQHLYIRQEIEPAFYSIYKKELTEYPNIHLVPFLKKPSKKFFEIMDTCTFVISPTCAEGQPGSVIECMAHGLIPIVSKEANIDTKDFGITLTKNSVEEISSTVKDVSQKPDTWFRQKSASTIKEIKDFYMPDQFLQNMKTAIQTIVDTKNNSHL